MEQQQQQQQAAPNDNNNDNSDHAKNHIVDYNDNHTEQQHGVTSTIAPATTTKQQHIPYHSFSVPPPPIRGAINHTNLRTVYPNGGMYQNNVHGGGWQQAKHYSHNDDQSAHTYKGLNHNNNNNGTGGNRLTRRQRLARNYMGGGRNNARHEYRNHGGGNNHQSNLSHQQHHPQQQQPHRTLLETPINMAPPTLLNYTAAGVATPTASLLQYAHSPHDHQQQQQSPQHQQMTPSHQQSPRDTPNALTPAYTPYVTVAPIAYTYNPTYQTFYTTPQSTHILAGAQGATGTPVLLAPLPLYNAQMFNYVSGYVYPQVFNPTEYQYITAVPQQDVGEGQMLDQENDGAAATPGRVYPPEIWRLNGK